MGRRFFSDGMELDFRDFNGITQALQRELYDRLAYEMLQRIENAFFGDSFKVNYVSGTGISVVKGLGFQTDSSQASPEPTRRMVYRGSDSSLSVTTPDASLDRIDIVCVKAALADELSDSRFFKDAISNVVSLQTFVVQKDWQAEFSIVAGTPNASPVAPATPAGFIKIAEILVSAVTGIANQSAITDTRDLMPVGAETVLSTLGYTRLTAASSRTLSEILAEVDSFLTNGRFGYADIVENNSPTAEIGAPAANRQRLFYRDGVLYLKDSANLKTPVGSGGGGGGGLVWTAPDGLAPLLEEEFGLDVFKFEAGLTQQLTVYLKVPDSYIAGRQINMVIGIYSPSASNTVLMQATARLIRKNVDAIDAPVASRTTTNASLTNTVAKQLRLVTLDLTAGPGTIGAFAVSAGDMIKVELTRATDTDTAEVRFMPTSTEVKFG